MDRLNVERATVLLVVAVALAAYVPTVAPTISWRNGGADSGDFAAAVATLGIPHPPGYPTYVLLGRLWTALPLGGDLAYRLNLLSASGAALAAGLTALAIFELGRGVGIGRTPLALGAGLGGLALALAPLTWSQATIAEVYAPGLAVLGLLTLLLLRARRRGDRGSFFLAGLVAGLGLGVLPQILLALPGAVALVLDPLPDSPRPRGRLDGPGFGGRVGRSLPAVGGLLAGLTVFAYLPVRAAARPMVNWGDPSSAGRFWAVVSAEQYHFLVGSLGPASWVSRLVEGALRLGGELAWAGLAAALVGGWLLWRSDRRALVYLASLVGLTLLFRAGYPAEGNVVYLLPALYGLALMGGGGIAGLLAAMPGGGAGKVLAGAALGLLLLSRGTAIAPRLDASGDDSAARFAERILAELPAKALVVSERDESTFSLWYYQAVGRRPDVVVVDGRLLFRDWYREQLLARYPDLDPAALRPGALTALDRPIFVLDGDPGEEILCPAAAFPCDKRISPSSSDLSLEVALP